MAQHPQRSAPAIALDRLIGPSTNRITCDQCFRIINVGELRYACLECYGWVTPEGQTRTVRQVEMQQTQVLQRGNFTVETSNTRSATGYDLCGSCARNSRAHEETGHHFALWITR